MATATAETPEATQAEGAEEPKRIGQLAFDGFAVAKHQVKIAGRTIEVPDEEAKTLKLGSTVTYTVTGRVVKRNNHLLTDDNGSTVEHDIVIYLDQVDRTP